MHPWSFKLLAMSKTVLKLRKCTNTVLNLALCVHIRSSIRLTTVFADVALDRAHNVIPHLCSP
jgi:hypothetical protein